MDFTLTEAQRDLSTLTRGILTDQVTQERLREIESKGDRFDRSLWKQLAEAGVLAAALPAAAGGDGFGLLEQCTVLSEIGRTVAPVPYYSTIVTAASTVAEFGDGAQRERWAAPAGRGELVLTAALVPDGAVQAVHSGDRWLLNGAFTTVPAATYADFILIPTADGALVVAPTDRGVHIEAQKVTGGEGAGWLRLSDVSVPADRFLPCPPSYVHDRATIGLCAAQLGVAERALELTAEYARTREQFGRPIGSFQAVAQRLADAYIDVEAIRLTLWQAAWRLREGLPSATELATAKFWAADAGHRVAHTAVHVHGGVGIDVDNALHRYFLAAKYNEFYLGGAAAHLRGIGAALAG